MEKRLFIAREILSTEKSYLDSLKTIVKSLKSPNPILSARQISDVFSNIRDIIQVNSELYAQLERRMEEWDINQCLGDIFVAICPFLKIYSVYVKNYQTAVRLVMELEKKPAFAQLLTDAAKLSDCRGLSLQSHLLTPVQRIPRYKLLLEDLWKKTPDDHKDKKNLRLALDSIEAVAMFVNEMIREHETVMRMIELQRSLSGLTEDLLIPGRKFVKQGVLVKVCRKTNKPRALFLFSDILIYASLNRSKVNTVTKQSKPQFASSASGGLAGSSASFSTQQEKFNQSYVFHRKFDLRDMLIVDVQDSEWMQHCFQVVTFEKSFSLICESAEEKADWINTLNTAISNYMKNRNTLKLHDDEKTRRESLAAEEEYRAPVWVPDHATIDCMECGMEFTILRRRHHCRSCGRVVCATCSASKIVIPSKAVSRNQLFETTEPVRVCNTCFKIIDGKLFHLKTKLQRQSVAEMEKRSSLNLESDSEKLSMDSLKRNRTLFQRVKFAIRKQDAESSEDDEEQKPLENIKPIEINRRKNSGSIANKRRTSFSCIHELTRPKSIQSVENLHINVTEVKRTSSLSLGSAPMTPPPDLRSRTKSELTGLLRNASRSLRKNSIQLLSNDTRIFFTEEQASPKPEEKKANESLRRVLLASYLMKRGKRFKSWKFRWIVLTQTEIIWFKPEEGQRARLDSGKINEFVDISNKENLMNSLRLSDCVEVAMASEEEAMVRTLEDSSESFLFRRDTLKSTRLSSSPFTDLQTSSFDQLYPFKLVCPRRTLYMVASTAEERDRWLDALTLAVRNAHMNDFSDLPPPPVTPPPPLPESI